MKNFYQFVLFCLFSLILSFSLLYAFSHRIYKSQHLSSDKISKEIRSVFTAKNQQLEEFQVKLISSNAKKMIGFLDERLVFLEQGLEAEGSKPVFQEINTKGLKLTDSISGSLSLKRAAFLAFDSKQENQPKSSTSLKKFYVWEEGFLLEEPLSLSLFGEWGVQFSAFGRKIFLTPKEKTSSIKLDSKELEKALAYQIKLRRGGSELSSTAHGENNLLHAELSLLSDFSNNKDQDPSIHKTDWSTIKKNEEVVSLKLVPDDIDSDGISDLLLFGPGEKKPYWQALSLGGIYGAAKGPAGELMMRGTWRLGNNAGVPFTGDFDGDGILDLGTYLPQQWIQRQGDKANWEIYFSSGKPLMTQETNLRNIKKFFWKSGDFLVVPGDYNGDGFSDIGLFQKYTGAWNILFMGEDVSLVKGDKFYPGNGLQIQFGKGGLPLQGDFNGDGFSDLAVYEEEGGKSFFKFLFLEKDTDFETTRNPKDDKPHSKVSRARTIEFGQPGDIPITADFNCNGKTDVAVYRPKEKIWLFRFGQNDIKKVTWHPNFPGKAYPIAADYDGDSCSDLGFFMKNPDSPGTWVILPYKFKASAMELMDPLGHNMLISQSFGRKNDLPTQIFLRRHHGFAFFDAE